MIKVKTASNETKEITKIYVKSGASATKSIAEAYQVYNNNGVKALKKVFGYSSTPIEAPDAPDYITEDCFYFTEHSIYNYCLTLDDDKISDAFYDNYMWDPLYIKMETIDQYGNPIEDTGYGDSKTEWFDWQAEMANNRTTYLNVVYPCARIKISVKGLYADGVESKVRSFIIDAHDYYSECAREDAEDGYCDICGRYIESEEHSHWSTQSEPNFTTGGDNCEDEIIAYYTCEECQEEYAENTGEFGPHSWTTNSTNSHGWCLICGEDCTHTSKDDFCSCNTCGATEHNWYVTWSEPTCEEGGYWYYSCQDCGTPGQCLEEGLMPTPSWSQAEALGHDYDSNGICTRCEAYDPSTCLLEGTPILMADGSTKAIENIKPGDLLQSYNPLTNEQTTAVAIGAYATGANKHFNVFSFSDGRSLHIYGRHGFYDNQMSCIKDIRDITSEDVLRNINNDTITHVNTETEHFDAPKNRYILISSNNLYYANGVLLGHSPWCKFKHVEKFEPNISKDVYNIFEKDLLAYRACRDYKLSQEFKEKLAIIANESLTLKNSCNKLRPQLRALRKDKAALVERKSEIGSLRQELNLELDKLQTVRTKYKDAMNKPRKEYFEECFKRDNEAFDLIYNYYQTKDTAQN